jgi:NAD(P)-dependent dehydrogenase (short-subunit alcohol dehydrogenase family)
MTTTKLFAGERALVTGSASNIGKAIAVALAREGAHVLLADIDPKRNAATGDEIRKAGGSSTELTADLSTKDGWKPVLEAARSPAVSMLVHSASPPRREVDHALAVTEEVWDGMVNANLRSGFFLARGVGIAMRDAGIKGRMLIITSLHAESPRNLPHYSASKAGLTMVTKELARALGPNGIRVNALAPGAVPGGGFNAAAFSFDGMIPLGRLGHADDMASMAVALLSDRFSAYVTGTTVEVDGGIKGHNWIAPVR